MNREFIATHLRYNRYVYRKDGAMTAISIAEATDLANGVAEWLSLSGFAQYDKVKPDLVGTRYGFEEFSSIMDAGEYYAATHNHQCNIRLIEQLKGKEGNHVRVTMMDKTWRSFILVKTTLWLAEHREWLTSAHKNTYRVTGAPFLKVEITKYANKTYDHLWEGTLLP